MASVNAQRSRRCATHCSYLHLYIHMLILLTTSLVGRMVDSLASPGQCCWCPGSRNDRRLSIQGLAPPLVRCM
eukprot:scaffold1575_cov352-Prasinococcus_capsulatus_cf.AAC.9